MCLELSRGGDGDLLAGLAALAAVGLDLLDDVHALNDLKKRKFKRTYCSPETQKCLSSLPADEKIGALLENRTIGSRHFVK